MSAVLLFAVLMAMSLLLRRWEWNQCHQGRHEWKGTRGTLEGRHAFVCVRRRCNAEKFERDDSIPAELFPERETT